MATAHQFEKGHRILIQAKNSWFPLVDINPQSFINIYETHYPLTKQFFRITNDINF